MFRLPGPRGANDRVEVTELGSPAQLSGELGSIRHQDGGIAFAPRSAGYREVDTANLLHLLHDLEVRVTASCADIEDAALTARQKVRQGNDVRSGNIHHMDVIANTRPVRSVVIGAEQRERLLPKGGLDGVGDQMRRRLVVFPPGPIGSRSRGVEVAQAHSLE